MKKYIFSTLAIALAVGFSSFTKPASNILKGKKFDTGIFWYKFEGTQIKADREDASKYDTPTSGQTPCGVPVSNECAVQVTVTLVGGLPPTNPDFTHVTFDGTTGMPNGGSDYHANALKN